MARSYRQLIEQGSTDLVWWTEIETMSNRQKEQISVTPAAEAILLHLMRYRVTTIDAVHALFYSDRSVEAARVQLFRMTAQGFLRRFEIRNRSFYQATLTGCAALGAPRTLAVPLSAQALIGHYGALAYCVSTSPPRKRLTANDLGAAFPELAKAPDIDATLQPYVFEMAGADVFLARLVVDYGGQAPLLISKCRRIERAAREGSLRDLTAAGAFKLLILCARQTKSQRLRELLRRHPLMSKGYPDPLPVEVIWVPQITHVLSSLPTTAHVRDAERAYNET